MSKRVTIVLDDALIAKLRKLQAEQIRTSEKSVSFSQVISDVLKTGLKS